MTNPQSIQITEELLKGWTTALYQQHRLDEFEKLRGFPPGRLATALPDLGWTTNYGGRWVIPIRNIDGECFHVKAWTNNPGTHEKWLTLGGGVAKHISRTQDKPIGQVFDLGWVLANAKTELDWLWITEGEFDCLMLRCFKWLATTLTTGASSSLSADFFIREFGGLELASKFLAHFSGIVLCYDCDDAGVRGMQRHASLLEEMFKRINEAGASDGQVEPLPSTFVGVKAVDLRAHPQWEALGKPASWDLSDFIRWAKVSGANGAKWLREQRDNSAAGIIAISDLLGLEYDENIGKPQLGDIMASGTQFQTMTFGELLRAGIDYAVAKQSRNEGWTHMAIVAARNGWTMEELWYQNQDDVGDGLGPMSLKARLDIIGRRLFPGKPDMPDTEMRGCFERAFVNYKQTDHLTDDASNVLRYFHYFPRMRYHPTRGWMMFEGNAWRPDEPRAFEAAMQLGGMIREEANRLAASNGDPKLVGALRRWMKQSWSMGKIGSVLNGASKHPLSRPVGTDWDSNPWLLGTSAGVFDLRENVLLDKSRSMNSYCSMTTNGTIDVRGWEGIVSEGNVDDVGVAARRWRDVLDSWFDDDEHKVMLQEIGGACLVGMLMQKVFVFESPGRSGKSLCLNAWGTALGNYAGIMLGSVLGTKSTDNSKSSAMAGIDGRRMVRIDEMGSAQIDVEMMKTLTGEQVLTARAMRENWAVIKNCATYVGTSNGLLNLSRDVSEALRSRVVYLRWPHTFVDSDLVGKGDYANDASVRIARDELGNLLDASGLGGHAMGTAVLTWMYGGLRRMLARDVFEVKVVEESRGISDVAWEESNLIKAYFEQSGHWRALREGEVGTIVATPQLRARMIEWARLVDPDFANELDKDPRAIGNHLRRQRGRGFVPLNNVKGALWGDPNKYGRAWQVPYIFVMV